MSIRVTRWRAVNVRNVSCKFFFYFFYAVKHIVVTSREERILKLFTVAFLIHYASIDTNLGALKNRTKRTYFHMRFMHD